MWSDVVAKVIQISGAGITLGGGDGEDGRGRDTFENAVGGELCIADQLREPDRVVDVAALLLGHDDPCGRQSWMWDDIGVHARVVRGEGYREVLLGGRGGEELAMGGGDRDDAIAVTIFGVFVVERRGRLRERALLRRNLSPSTRCQGRQRVPSSMVVVCRDEDDDEQWA